MKGGLGFVERLRKGREGKGRARVQDEQSNPDIMEREDWI